MRATPETLKSRMRVTTMREVFRRLAKYSGQRIVDEMAEEGVKAMWDEVRWVARCECGGAEVVDPAEPVFFCCSCGNAGVGGRWRPVVFPEDVEVSDADK